MPKAMEAIDLTRELLGRSRYVSGILREEDDIAKARRLATGVFVKCGKIPENAVDEKGFPISDIYLPNSNFVGTYNRDDGVLLATLRVIWSLSSTVRDLRLPEELINYDDRRFLEKVCEPGEVAELGALAKANPEVSVVAVLKTLETAWAFAGKNGIRFFVCGLDPNVYERSFKKLFGNALHRLSDHEIKFPGVDGPDQVPLIIDVEKAAQQNRLSSPFRSLIALTAGHIVTRDYDPGSNHAHDLTIT
jgi:hypothetical protein